MSTQTRTKGWEKESKINPDYEYERLLKLENKFHIKAWINKGEKEGYLYNIVPTTMNVVAKNSNKSHKKTGNESKTPCLQGYKKYINISIYQYISIYIYVCIYNFFF